MITDVQIAWLAGIIDGEGCIYGAWANRGRHSTGGSMGAQVRVQATSMAMISRVAEICAQADICAVVELGSWRPLSNRACHRVSIRKISDVVRFLRLVRPYLVVKTDQTDFVIKWYEKWGDQRRQGAARASREEKIVFFDTLRAMKRA